MPAIAMLALLASCAAGGRAATGADNPIATEVVTLQVSDVATLISHSQMQQYRVGYPDASLVAVKDKGSRRFWM